jgi:hypothetical protein
MLVLKVRNKCLAFYIVRLGSFLAACDDKSLKHDIGCLLKIFYCKLIPHMDLISPCDLLACREHR